METRYFLGSRERFFEVLFATDFDEALSVPSAYETGGIPELPDLYERVYSITDVTAIGRTRKGFILHVGDIYCGGCTAKLIVKAELDPSGRISKLVFVDALDSICI